jgi:hypothetical protein
MTTRLLTIALVVSAAALLGGAIAAATTAAKYEPAGGDSQPHQSPPNAYDPPGGGSQSSTPTSPTASSSAQTMTASRGSQSAYLTGSAEVGDQGNAAGDPDAKGAVVLLAVDERTLCYGFTLKGADTPTVVHIHRGKPGKNGPPVITFANPPKNAAGAPAGNPGASSGCKTLTDPAEIQALARVRANPAGYYINIHTQSFPNGAVRGQLTRMLYSNG